MGGLEEAIPAIGCIFSIILLMGGFILWYGIRQNKSVIERAKKIDPSVKTITDARYVLQKDIAKSVGAYKDNKE